MDDEALPFEMKRLNDQENKQILPHQEEIKVINLGNNEEKKEVKGGYSVVSRNEKGNN